MSDYQDKVIQLSCKISASTGKELMYILPQLLRRLHNRNYQIVHGKQSLRKLNQQNREIQAIPITDADIKVLKKQLNRYSVDFSVLKEPDGTMQVYFKAQDVDRVYNALKHIVKNLNPDQSKRLSQTIAAAKAKAEQLNQVQEQKSSHRAHEQDKDTPKR